MGLKPAPSSILPLLPFIQLLLHIKRVYFNSYRDKRVLQSLPIMEAANGLLMQSTHYAGFLTRLLSGSLAVLSTLHRPPLGQDEAACLPRR